MMSSAIVHHQPYVIDPLLRSLSGNRVAAKKLVRIFLDMYPEKIALFDAALQVADWVALRRVVHDLRGTCAIVSASCCLFWAAKLENTLPEQVSPELLVECACFKSALAEVVAALQLFLTDPPDSVRSAPDEASQ